MNLPEEFAENARHWLGDALFEALAEALAGEPPVSIRLNPKKEEIPLGGSARNVPWASAAYYLSQRPAFTFDPFFHAGCYYVQEAASMFMEQAVRQCAESPTFALDLCAAPGGKSTLLRALLPDDCLLVANEPIRPRTQILAENLTKWGHPSIVVTQSFPNEFSAFPDTFDFILADVPCSGEGMFRKDEQAIAEWSLDNVRHCQQRQREILTDVWPALRAGGLLIYSTCTFNPYEDEDNVAWLVQELGAEPIRLQTDAEWGITGSLSAEANYPMYHFLPGRTQGEGFFLAAFRKKGTPENAESTQQKKERKPRKEVRQQPIPPQCGTWLAAPETMEFVWSDNRLVAFPRQHAKFIQQLRAQLHVVLAGAAVGEQKGKDFIPAHALAMSTQLRREAFPQVDLDYASAVAYLRKEAIALPGDVPRGFVLLTYRGVPLGFVKNVGNRANNLYPQEWRIRSGYVPDEEVIIG